MAVNISKDNDITVVSYEGRLDSTTAGEMERAMNALVEEGVRNISVDLEKTEYISSRGIRILVSTYRNICGGADGTEGGKMEVVNCNSSVKEIFRLSGLTEILDVK